MRSRCAVMARVCFAGMLSAAVLFAALSAWAGDASAAAPRCSAAQLRGRAGWTSGALGSEGATFGFTNVTSRTCTVYGYPRLTLIGPSGAALPTVDREAVRDFDSVPERVVALGRGSTAWFLAFFPIATGYANLKCPTSARLRLTLPYSRGSVLLSGAGAHIDPYGGSTVHLQCGSVQVTPLAPARYFR